MEEAIEKLKNLIRSQSSSLDFWIRNWEKHKDPSSVRNVALALGKISGMVSALTTLNGVLPEKFGETANKCDRIWSEL